MDRYQPIAPHVQSLQVRDRLLNNQLRNINNQIRAISTRIFGMGHARAGPDAEAAEAARTLLHMQVRQLQDQRAKIRRELDEIEHFIPVDPNREIASEPPPPPSGNGQENTL
jgi:chaperonin cofactor prefoldin